MQLYIILVCFNDKVVLVDKRFMWLEAGDSDTFYRKMTENVPA
jgi:hypothetical protein